MPLQWTIDHEKCRVNAIVDGVLTTDDLRIYLQRVAEAGAMPYAKLFDATNTEGSLPVGELKSIGASIRQHAMHGPIGPLAIVVADSGTQFQATHFADAAGSNRPLQIFRDKVQAERWLSRSNSRPNSSSS